ncbi:3-isopropylmalate/(R)-2-methylmalate dehydratase large subunit [Herbinix hemicellulosilytica]|uniref:3-isopropylmalate dehydratase large subunit n=1 Tax=Herbinix hemicellulosilytica TaxID=1564487 RepID=A0A0H5SDS4_HERHM|nr:3-isopropylmalate dehydratase large subunit [Herbinix hemicellulosilytica]RBP60311.1 3-isopropylmalate/(R)-2-methylmalate dehydratase large subunit [Herbinix hemicellulosilytica]CRZ33547.1 3-isopropylmalate dehydratase large subunit [Herbinix hemicellulosilytica]
MGMTMTQKILAAHAGLDKVSAGQLIEVNLDLVLGNDVTAPVAIKEMEKLKKKGIFDKDKIALVPDHFTPNKDIKSAQNCKCMRDFAKEYDITHYFEIGEMGIEHALLPEKGLVVAGDVVIGADSHTCTYGALGAFSTGVGSTDMAAGMATGKAWFKVPSALKFILKGKPAKWVSGKDIILHIIGMIGVDGARYQSMEFVGDGIAHLSMDDRFTIANMAIEAGAKNGIFSVDDVTIQYMKEHSSKPYTIYEADEDAEYEQVYEIELDKIRPTVAFPHLPENTRTIDEVGDIKIDQVVIGSCTNGRLDDLRAAARVLEGKKVAKGVRVIIFPATQKIYLQALEEGLIATFIKAGAVVSTPTCGPCLGGHMGVLAAGERAVSTTNRNFVGRMGHVDSEVYLASPAVAAASAVTGKISSPEELGL